MVSSQDDNRLETLITCFSYVHGKLNSKYTYPYISEMMIIPPQKIFSNLIIHLLCLFHNSVLSWGESITVAP